MLMQIHCDSDVFTTSEQGQDCKEPAAVRRRSRIPSRGSIYFIRDRNVDRKRHNLFVPFFGTGLASQSPLYRTRARAGPPTAPPQESRGGDSGAGALAACGEVELLHPRRLRHAVPARRPRPRAGPAGHSLPTAPTLKRPHKGKPPPPPPPYTHQA